MNTYRGEMYNNENQLIRSYEESTTEDWSVWRFSIALKILKPNKHLIKWFRNGKRFYAKVLSITKGNAKFH